MLRIEALRNYPVAGMDGYPVTELTITPEAIIGNRSFAVVHASEIAKYAEDPTYIPLRMTQVRFPQLTLFKTESEGGKLVIYYEDDSHQLEQSIAVAESGLPFHSPDEQMSVPQLLQERALPFRVARSSSSKRWAVDCGDAVAEWLSERIGEEVRLVKAVAHPESPKYHFTWYTALHAILAESAEQLAADTQTDLDLLTFRYNVLLAGAEQAYEEESWEQLVINGTQAVVEACKRCGYIGIDRTTGILAQHMQVLTNIAKEHSTNFGVYIQPEAGVFLTVRVGDLVYPK